MKYIWVLCVLFFVTIQGITADECKGTGKEDECPDETTQVTRKVVTSKTDDSTLDVTLKCLDENKHLLYTCTTSEKNPFPNVHVTRYQFFGTYSGGRSNGPVLINTNSARNRDSEVLKPHSTGKYDDVETFD